MPRSALVLVTLVLAAFAGFAHAATVSGSLTPAYGPPLVVQTTQTPLDALSGAVDLSGGSELDAAYAYVANDTLYLFLAGNLQLWLQMEGLITHADPLYVFVDCAPGGQNTLLPNDPSLGPTFDLAAMAGLTFDSGFEADYCFGLASASYPTLQAFSAALPAGGGGAGVLLGQTSCGGPGALSGGSDPYGIAVTLDDANVAGVTQGCGAASGAGVASGVEWAIPLAAIGHPSGCIRVCAVLEQWNTSSLLNQVLGPVPAGTCALGPASGVNFAAIAGDQYFTWCPSAVPARSASWGALKAHYR